MIIFINQWVIINMHSTLMMHRKLQNTKTGFVQFYQLTSVFIFDLSEL